MLDWRLLLRGNLFQHILFPQLQKNAREQFARWSARKNSPDWPHAAVRFRAVPPHLFTGSITEWCCNEQLHGNGTLMQDLRQHAGVTGREEIGVIIGPCRCSDHSAYYNQMLC